MDKETRKKVEKAMQAAGQRNTEPPRLMGDKAILARETEFPWERQPGEPNLWYDRFFMDYIPLGSRRNITQAYRHCKAREDGDEDNQGFASPAWNRYAYQWNWVTRAEAYDDYMRQLEQEKWEQRRIELREEEWRTSQVLFFLANNMAEQVGPAKSKNGDAGSEASSEDRGGTPGRVPPKRVGFKASDVPRYVEVGSKVGRLAAEMDTERTVNVNIHTRIEEVRQKRWSQAQDVLSDVLDAEYEEIEDEAVQEPPTVDNPSNHSDASGENE